MANYPKPKTLMKRLKLQADLLANPGGYLLAKTGDSIKLMGQARRQINLLLEENEELKKIPKGPQWYPVDGNTRGYVGEILLMAEDRAKYNRGHSNHVSSDEVTTYYRSSQGERMPAYQATLNMGSAYWTPLV